MENELLQIGIVGIALLFLIRELFVYLKTKNHREEKSINKQLLNAITTQNDNHLKTMQHSIDVICKDINTGNDRIVSAISAMHTDLASRLGEIKGKIMNK